MALGKVGKIIYGMWDFVASSYEFVHHNCCCCFFKVKIIIAEKASLLRRTH